MKPCPTMLLLGALSVLWMVPARHAPAQAPTEKDLRELERQAEELENKQAPAKADAKRKAEAGKKAAAAAAAKRKAAQKQAEEQRRATEEARSARPESDGRERATEVESALAGELVDIPGGSFEMACLPGYIECDDDERPRQHTVFIKPFRMGKYEVTVSQFRRFVEGAGYRTDAERVGNCWGVPGAEPAGRDWRKPGFPQTERHPVVCVSWNDAQAYAQWLSRQGVGRYRLPSVSEWEYAARGGSRAQHSFADSKRMLCQYGNVADRAAQRFLKNNWKGIASCDDGAVYTAPVGGYRPNGFGLHDMQGNVWEWTGDCYHDRDASAPPDGVALTAGDCARRVLLGGSWYGPPWIVGTTLRFGYVTDTRAGALGFRLLQDR